MREQTDALLRQWGEWHCRGRGAAIRGYSQSLLARCLGTRVKRPCPACVARGEHPGKLLDEDGELRVCPICHGSGRIDYESPHWKIDPAFIPSTRPQGEYFTPERYERVDRAVFSLPDRARFVILTRYVHLPRASQPKCAWWVGQWLADCGHEKPKMSVRTFQRVLADALHYIALHVYDGRPDDR